MDELNDDFLRPEFVDQMKNLRKRIYKKVKPKMLNGKFLSGNMLLEITKAYIQAINSGSVPNIENAWTYLCKQESHKALEESLTFVDKKISENSESGPLEATEIKKMKNTVNFPFFRNISSSKKK